MNVVYGARHVSTRNGRPSLNTPVVAIANLLPCPRMDVAKRVPGEESLLTTA